jgi:hypothetical protein
MPQATERRYGLFVHYGLSSDQWMVSNSRFIVKADSILPRLHDDANYLRDVLAPGVDAKGQRWDGFAFVFLDPGWTELLKVGMEGLDLIQFGADLEAAHAEITRKLREKAGHPFPVRIVTAAPLINLLRLLDANARQYSQFQRPYFQFFAGGANQLRYDGSKVVEGAIRIGNIGRQVPIFRFDDDVIFFGGRTPGTNRAREIKRTRSGILRLCERYHQLSVDPEVHYFVYSGRYAEPKELEPASSRANEAAILNGFATRVVQLASLPEHTPVRKEETARVSSGKAACFLQDLYHYGANPLGQVISGAGLCLSDSAILDLPPFSNMRLNVVWIDDHLKYALHHELGHLGVRRRTRHSARVQKARFSQLRREGPPTYENVRWHLQVYMLRLILGCVADAWLRNHPGLKRTLKELGRANYDALMMHVPGYYAREFLDVLPRGWSTDGKRKLDFQRGLWKAARVRLTEIVEAWDREEFRDTFLGVFVDGMSHPRHREFRDYLPKGIGAGLRVAVQQLPAEYPEALAIEGSIDDPDLDVALKVLVEDFVEYFELVLFWKYFTQSVRFMLNRDELRRGIQGEDLDWMLPFEPRH